jgi:hypothetical protein
LDASYAAAQDAGSFVVGKDNLRRRPIALIAHSDFSKWQAHYVQRTLWTDEQFERRLNRRVLLPREHSKEDMLKIAKAHLPNGDSPSWKLLAAYALVSEKNQASGMSKLWKAQSTVQNRMAVTK